MSSSNSHCSAGGATTPQHPLDKPRCQVTRTGDSGTSGWGKKQGAPTFLSWYPFSYSQRDCTKRRDEDRIFPLLTTLCINCTVSLCTSSTYSPGFCSTHRSRGTGHQREKRKEKKETPCSLLRLSPGSHVSCLSLPLATILPGRTPAGLLPPSSVLVTAAAIALWVLSPSGQQRWERGEVGAGRRRRGPAGIRGSIQLRQIIQNDSFHFLAKAS